MNEGARISPILMVPARSQSNRSVWQARQMFSHTLSCWAVDVLALRRSGAGEAVWRQSPAAVPIRKAA